MGANLCKRCCYTKEYMEPLIKVPKDIIIFTSSMTSDRRLKYNSTKLKLLLDIKKVPYTNIDLSIIDSYDRIEINKLLGKDMNGVLPALYADMIYIGDYYHVQDLEDHSELDKLIYN